MQCFVDNCRQSAIKFSRLSTVKIFVDTSPIVVVCTRNYIKLFQTSVFLLFGFPLKSKSDDIITLVSMSKVHLSVSLILMFDCHAHFGIITTIWKIRIEFKLQHLFTRSLWPTNTTRRSYETNHPLLKLYMFPRRTTTPNYIDLLELSTLQSLVLVSFVFNIIAWLFVTCL